MPTYDYRCTACGKVEERTVSNWRDAVRHIELCECGKGVMEKQWPAPAFVVSGFNAKNGYAGGK